MPTKSTRRKNDRLTVQYATRRRGVPGAGSLRAWAALVPMEATLRIVGAAEARKLNLRYRGKPYATNVLSFAYENGRGDIVLCHPVIAREARAQAKSLAAHYAHLLLHGLLHLRGYRHDRKREAQRMAREETRLLARAGFGNPYTVE